jgi:hypothetical protein
MCFNPDKAIAYGAAIYAIDLINQGGQANASEPRADTIARDYFGQSMARHENWMAVTTGRRTPLRMILL